MLPVCFTQPQLIRCCRRHKRKPPKRLAGAAITNVSVRKTLTASVRGNVAGVITIGIALAEGVVAVAVAVAVEAPLIRTVLDAPARVRRRPSVAVLMIIAAHLVQTRMFLLAGAGAENTRLAPPSHVAALGLALRRRRVVAVAPRSAARGPALSPRPAVAMAVVAIAETGPAHAALSEDRGGREAPPAVKIEPDLLRRPIDLAHARLDAAAVETVRLRLHLPVAHLPLARAGTVPGAATLRLRRFLARVALAALMPSTRDLPHPPTTTETSALMFARAVTVATAAVSAATAGARALLVGTQSVADPLTCTNRRRGVGTHRPSSQARLPERTAGPQQLQTRPCMMLLLTRLVNNAADRESCP